MTQRHLDFHPARTRTKPAHERLVDLLRAEGTCSTWRIMAALEVRGVSHLVGRANHTLALVGQRIENLSAPGEVARYAICEDRTSPGRMRR
jgi:hypothetical protein